jgi:hypothetical protein
MAVYVPMPSGGTAGQRGYFHDNFRMELIGANYPSVETAEESVFTLAMEIVDNPDFDATIQAGDENKRYMLNIQLQWSSDNSEIVRYSFYFNDTESMADWNLYLLYQAMANAPMPEDEAPETVVVTAPLDDRWRNQTLYLNLNAGLGMSFFIRPGDSKVETGSLMPFVMAGLEWHLLDFLSLELDPVKPRLMKNDDNYLITLSGSLAVKGVLKLGATMLEPYAGMEGTMSLNNSPVPLLSALGGIQLGVRGAPQSAWVIDIGATKNVLGTFQGTNGDNYNMLTVHLLAGFKFGFIDRKPKSDSSEQ